jgi:MFS family permease
MADHNPPGPQSPTPGARPTHARFVVLTFLCVLSFLTYYDRICIARAQKEIQADLALTDVQMGWVLGIFWFAYALFEIPGGWLGDRYGARGTLTRVVLMWSLFTVLSGGATGFLSLLAFRFLFGVGEAGAYPNIARVQSAWFAPASRARIGGLIWLCARWGGAFSPFLAGSLMSAWDGTGMAALTGWASWRASFLVAGLMGAVWCVLFWPWFRDDPAAHPSVNAAERDLIAAGRAAAPPADHGMPAAAWGALFTAPSLWAIAFVYICGSFGWSFFVSWMPRFLEEHHGVAFSSSQDFWKQPLFWGGFACLIGGFLSDRLLRATGSKWLGRAVFPMGGCAVAAAAIFSVRYVSDPDAAIVLMCLAGAAYDFGQGANWSAIVDIGGRYAGAATGFINMVGNMGNFASPIAGAWIFTTFGWEPLFAIYSAAFLLAASMWLVINPARTFYEGREPPPAFPVSAATDPQQR